VPTFARVRRGLGPVAGFKPLGGFRRRLGRSGRANPLVSLGCWSSEGFRGACRKALE